MTYQKRRTYILDQLNRVGEVFIKTLAGEIQTSEITVRRDIKQMADEGLLMRTHGGAIKISAINIPVSFANKSAVNHEAKDKICKRAAEEIKDGDVIFLDCGSTVFRICQYIRNLKIKIITNSLPIIIEMEGSLATVNLIGGEFDYERQAVQGRVALDHISRYHADKAFLGIDGITADGLFASSEKEASITQAMLSQSKTNFFLADKSKLNRERYLRFASVDSMKHLVTDADDQHCHALKAAGVKVIQVSYKGISNI